MIAVDVSRFYIDDEPFMYQWCVGMWGKQGEIWKWDSSIVRSVNQYLFDTAEHANAFREQWEPK
jgi:hypothetical protein